MQVKQYKKIKIVLFVLLAILFAFSYIKKSALPAFFGTGFYLMITSLLKTRVKGVLADERQQKVAAKAAQVSFRILLPMLLLTSIALIMAGGEQQFYYIKALGIIFSYITCLALMINLLVYWYFDKKSGGQDK